MCQSGSLGRVRIGASQLFNLPRKIRAKPFGNSAGDLTYLERVGEAVVEDMSAFRRRDLRSFRETGESVGI